MSKPLKLGLFVGAIAAVINLCVSFLLGFCGPAVALAAGAIVGYLIGHTAFDKSQAAREGALSGAVVGLLLLVSQILAGVSALTVARYLPAQNGWFHPPAPSAPPSEVTLYYLGGIGAGACFGLIDIALAALSGFFAAHFSAQDAPPPPPPVFE